MRSTVSLLILVVLIATQAHGETIPIGQPFVLKLGESATVGELSFLVHFDELLSDSRCPSDVTCFWEGEATAALKLGISGGESISVELHTPLSPFGPAETEFAGHVVTLRRVDPYPSIQDPIDPRDYQVELVVNLSSGVPTGPSSWSTLKLGFRQ